MNRLKITCLALGSLLGAGALNGCVAQALEEELNIVFLNEGEIIDTASINQFKNAKTPTIPDAYVPLDYRFVGWTPIPFNKIDYSSVTAFRSQYIAANRMVHYMDAKPYAENKTVVYNALILPKDEIPKEYHYVVVAWYDRPATSGLTGDSVAKLETKFKEHLAGEGVSQEDLNSIVFRGYSGQVGPSTGEILFDGDVDIMFGWGSVDNITTTGSIPLESVYASEAFPVTYEGAVKNRMIHRISDTENAKHAFEYLSSDAAKALFA